MFDTSSEPSAAEPARPVLGAVADAVTALGKALTEPTWALQDAELGRVLEQLDELRRGTERLLVDVTGDATGRGTPDGENCSSATDWVAGHCPSLGAPAAHQTVKVANACKEAKHGPLAEAVRAGEVSVRRADRVLAAMGQIEPFLTFEQHIADEQIVLPIAMTGTDRQLRLALAHLVACARPQDDSDEFEVKQRRGRGLFERAVAGGLAEFVWRLDPEGAAFVRAAIGPLAKPAPDEDGPDPRSPQQRRSDALLAVLQRGMTSPGQAPTTSNAKVIITISWEQLVGRLRGVGCTMTGEPLSVRAIRRLACEADLIPTVLGGEGEVLDMGRQVRLATGAQRRALWLTQRGCTYQGCSMPAQWCAAHHGVWWSRDGDTDLDNLFLLCPRHHTIVHEQDLRPVEHDGHYGWQP